VLLPPISFSFGTSASGIASWSLLFLAVAVRWIKSRTPARLLFRLHRIFAYCALAVATLHGALILFL
jgi:hypothetical protein